MITTYVHDGSIFVRHKRLPRPDAGIVRIDLLNPEVMRKPRSKRSWASTRREMMEFEISSRLHTEDGTLFMTAIRSNSKRRG